MRITSFRNNDNKVKVVSIVGKHRTPIWVKNVLKAAIPPLELDRQFNEGVIGIKKYLDIYEGQIIIADLRKELEQLKKTVGNDLVLACYCSLPGLCHRSRLAKVLKTVGFDVNLD